MKILIIYCHPNLQSFNGAILSALTEALGTKKHEVQLIDLYAENFDPVLRFDDVHKRRDLQFDPETAGYREKILWAEHLIFIFPIWWGGMPAMLKGYVERVFASDFAYHYEGLFPKGHFAVKHATIITTHDTPTLYVRLFQQDYGRVLKRQVLKTMLGITHTKFLQMPALRYSSEKKRQKFLEKVANYASKM
jgi:NAD(P)H dehydrogenase (quinone)